MPRTFDCVEWQDRQALRIHAETRDLTREQELAYWARHTRGLIATRSKDPEVPSLARESAGPYHRGG